MKRIKEKDIVKGIIVERKNGGIYFYGPMFGYKREIIDKYFDLISDKEYHLYSKEKDMRCYPVGLYVTDIEHVYKREDNLKEINESELKLLVEKYMNEYILEQENIKDIPYLDDLLVAGYEKTDYTDEPDTNTFIFMKKYFKKQFDSNVIYLSKDEYKVL